MGKYLPKEARAVYAFQWKTNSTTCMWEIINFLHGEDIDFEIHGEDGEVFLLVGQWDMAWDPTKYVKVPDMHWLVIDGDDLCTMPTTSFVEKYAKVT